jgi:hypothetical protein
MSTSLFPACRHRRPTASPGVADCRSPKLVGLKLVTSAVCQACCYQDHEPPVSVPHTPTHLLPCAFWRTVAGQESPGSEEKYSSTRQRAGEGCSHPHHLLAPPSECDTCPDYLFPVLTPQTPVKDIQQLISLPPRPQPEGWWTWPNVQEAHRLAAAEHMDSAPLYLDTGQERGVVMVGGGRYFVAAYVTIRVLRHVGCQLPIELWHLTGEIDPPMQSILEPYGVICVNADEFARRHPFRFLEGHWWKGWQLKAYAIAHSRFREILFLDADSYPTRNPEPLFDWEDYRTHGAIFWPDCGTSAFLLPAEKWQIFGTEPREPPFESGQLVIDKSRCSTELQLTLWYNAHADFVYHILWGDKDTFNIAWRRLGRDYAMPRTHCSWDTHTILQYGPDGEILFQHRCQDKFCLTPQAFLSTCQPFAGNQYNPRLALEDQCFQFREELRLAWHSGEGSEEGSGSQRWTQPRIRQQVRDAESREMESDASAAAGSEKQRGFT